MARTPQAADAPTRKRKAKTSELPPVPPLAPLDRHEGATGAAEAAIDDFDDILGDLATAVMDEGPDAPNDVAQAETQLPVPEPVVAEVDPLDDILDDLAQPSPAESDPLDDILGTLASPAPDPEPEPDPLDDILGELATRDQGETDPLDDILGELTAPPPAPPPGEPSATAIAETDPLDDILGEMIEPSTSSPATEAVNVDPFPDSGNATDDHGEEADAPGVVALDMDELLGEMGATADATATGDGEPAAEAGSGEKTPKRKLKLPTLSIPPAARRVAAVVTGLAASHALAFWLGTLSHVAANPEGPVAAESEHAESEDLRPEGIERFAGKDIDARIDGRTLFETEEFSNAVDELVGGQEASEAIAELLPKIRATQPIVRDGGKLKAKGCNPKACGLENLTVTFDLAAKSVRICATRSIGEPPQAASTMYDDHGARGVEACDGYPHPPAPKPRATTDSEAEPDNPADITLTAGHDDKGTLSDRIHEELARMRNEKRRKRRYE